VNLKGGEKNDILRKEGGETGRKRGISLSEESRKAKAGYQDTGTVLGRGWTSQNRKLGKERGMMTPYVAFMVTQGKQRKKIRST